MEVGIIILAAGRSERLGHPKQLVKFNGQGLLTHTVKTALAISDRVAIVLGAFIAQIVAELDATKAVIVENQSWEEGMGSSIRIGLNTIQDIYPDCEAVIFLACDQPFVTEAHLQTLVTTAENSPKTIVASQYANTSGIPVLFKKQHWPALLEIKGDKGAHSVLANHSEDIENVFFKNGEIDVDTPEDEILLRDNN